MRTANRVVDLVLKAKAFLEIVDPAEMDDVEWNHVEKDVQALVATFYEARVLARMFVIEGKKHAKVR